MTISTDRAELEAEIFRALEESIDDLGATSLGRSLRLAVRARRALLDLEELAPVPIMALDSSTTEAHRLGAGLLNFLRRQPDDAMYRFDDYTPATFAHERSAYAIDAGILAELLEEALRRA